MFRKIVLFSLITLLLLLSSCGAAPGDSAEAPAPPAEIESEAIAPTLSIEESAVDEAPPPPPTFTPQPPAETLALETDPALSQQDPNCTDPFAGAELNFSPQYWTANFLSSRLGSEIVHPESTAETNFCLHSVPYSEIRSGGPLPDGIPPIDNPQFVALSEADDWLADVEPLIALTVAGESKAYPLSILTQHEIVNDEIAGEPVAVTFCPLCNAAIVFKRTVNGQVLRFGVSGNLRNSDLIMWDNRTLSWWQQFTGEAIVGELVGTRLEMIPAQLVAWQDYKAAHPDGLVLSAGRGGYGVNPYTNYDSTDRPFLFDGEVDSRLRATERVLGYQADDLAKAYALPALAEAGLLTDQLGGLDVVIFYQPGQVSALDQRIIADSKEVGSAAMFQATVAGQLLDFAYDGGKIVDEQTGSVWNIFGQAVSGELAGTQLTPVLSHVHFWFAWAAFRPDTALFGG